MQTAVWREDGYDVYRLEFAIVMDPIVPYHLSVRLSREVARIDSSFP